MNGQTWVFIGGSGGENPVRHSENDDHNAPSHFLTTSAAGVVASDVPSILSVPSPGVPL